MYTQCTTQKAAEQQRVLENALLEMALRRPYGKITVSALCASTGVSRKTFYRLFETKEDVLCALVDSALTGYIPLVPLAPPWGVWVEPELRRFLLYWRAQKPVMDLLSRVGRTGLLVERCMLHTQKVPPEVQRRFGLTDSLVQGEKLLFLFCGVSGLLVSWHESGYAKPVEEMASMLCALMTGPLLRFDVSQGSAV